MPHNPGEPDTPLRLGVPTIFDLYPREIGGYFHDTTRTWCFGYAPDPVKAVYDEVWACFKHLQAACRPGLPGGELHKMACDYFRDRGHPVSVDDPNAQQGFLAALGHGVGLEVHEEPYLGHSSPMLLAPGHVFTIEPGLYYTDRQVGVRIEDTVYLDAGGQYVTITDVPYDLVVPIAGR